MGDIAQRIVSACCWHAICAWWSRSSCLARCGHVYCWANNIWFVRSSWRLLHIASCLRRNESRCSGGLEILCATAWQQQMLDYDISIWSFRTHLPRHRGLKHIVTSQDRGHTSLTDHWYPFTFWVVHALTDGITGKLGLTMCRTESICLRSPTSVKGFDLNTRWTYPT